jgi:hypothetical protein
MPIRYTISQVAEIFKQQNCLLISDKYENQLGKLHYEASCGHHNIISLKTFLRGAGQKCRKCAFDIPTYEMACKKFEDKNCKLSYTKEEFNFFYKNYSQKLEYVASCGHEHAISLGNFNEIKRGINCPTCEHKNISIRLTKLYSDDNKLGALEQELKGINYFKDLIHDSFISVKAFDGCKSDVIIKPTACSEDLWLGIQVKTTHDKTEIGKYCFKLNSGKYENCILLCFCEEDKRSWLIPYEEVIGITSISISVKSKYNKYEVTNETIIEKLNHYYTLCNKVSFTILDTPISKTCKQEQHFRKYRENKLDFIQFTNNEMEGLVYDFMIENKKVQEKVGTVIHNNPNSFSFGLNKYDCRINGKCVKKCYEKGDNDLYWLNCKNNLFYVIPETILIEQGILGENGKKVLYVSPTNKNTEWCNDYLFDYDSIDKVKLLQIINSI